MDRRCLRGGNVLGVARCRKLHAGKYEELTSLRQRGGGGWQSGQPPPYPLSEGSCANYSGRGFASSPMRLNQATRFRTPQKNPSLTLRVMRES